MGKIIAVSNQKGGVGKSTTAINLSACLAERLKKVLVVDLDPQGNTTSGLGIQRDYAKKTIYDVLVGEAGVEESVIRTEFGRLYVLPSNVELAGGEIELMEMENREFLLKKALKEVKKKYDYIIIDCPPSLSLLTLNALSAADSVLIPVQCEYYALEGLSQLIKTINLVRERLNEDLKVNGIIFTMYDGRTKLAGEVVENVKENLDIYTYKSMIPRNVRLAESPSYGMPIIRYDTHSSGAMAYRELAQELNRRKKV